MLDVTERFFKLTLDNVYRFIASSIFVISLIGLRRQVSPTDQLATILEWLAIPTAWLTTVDQWLVPRQGILSIFVLCVLVIAIPFSIGHSWTSRYGATVILSSSIIIELDRIGLLGLLLLIFIVRSVWSTTYFNNLYRKTYQHSKGDWSNQLGTEIWWLAKSIVYAVSCIFTPIAWLIGQDRRDILIER